MNGNESLEKCVCEGCSHKGVFECSKERKCMSGEGCVVLMNEKGTPILKVWAEFVGRLYKEDEFGNKVFDKKVEPKGNEVKDSMESIYAYVNKATHHSKGDITSSVATLAATTAINVQPASGVKQQIVGITQAETDADGAALAGNILGALFNGTNTVSFMISPVYPNRSTANNNHAGGLIITNGVYLRLYNSGADTDTYGYVLLEV